MNYFSIIISVILRLIPHPVNVSPIGSLALINSKKYGMIQGILVALLAMLISDIFLGFSFASPFVYLGFMSYAFFGYFKKLNPVAAVTLGSSAFFLISNFGVWIGPWYPHTLAGLVSCYVNALPFFRNTLVGDLVIVTALSVALNLFSKLNLNFNLKEEFQWVKSSKAVSLKRR
jgi:hypothetical protein